MKMKRFLTTMLLLFFTFTMLPASNIFADTTPTTGTLTMTNESDSVRSNSEYSAYKIISFDLSKDSDNKFVYTNLKLDPIYKAAVIASVDGLTAGSTDYQIFDAISKLTGEKIDKLAYALKGVAAAATATAVNGVFNNLAYGYYLVIETANGSGDGTVISKPILVAIPDSANGNSNIRVKVKTSKATIEKKIVEDNNLYDSSTAAVGDVINYRAVSTIPTYPSDAQNITYYITDTFSAGLSFNSDISARIIDVNGNIVKELNSVPNNDYTLDMNIPGVTFRLTLNHTQDIKDWGNHQYKLLVTYSATLNDNASYGSIGNPNSINLTYSNKPDSSQTYKTPDDTVISYTTRLVIVKTDGGSNLPLPGVTFELKKKSVGVDGTVTWNKVEEDKITDQDGKAYFAKLEQGSYQLTETHAPSGYILLDKPIEFTISAKNDVQGTLTTIPNTNILVNQIGNEAAKGFLATWISDNTKEIAINSDGLNANIKNTKGFTLPGTGGIGTTIFTVVGISIILLGCSMILIYMKKTKRLSSAK